jgi:hypothetical protein
MARELYAAQPGDEAKDLVTGFRGIVTARTTWLHGCNRLAITPTKLGSDGQPVKEATFDEQRIEVIKRGKVPSKLADATVLTNLGMGSEATDTVTGYKGIISAITVTLGGDIHVFLEPEKLKKDGDPFDLEVFHSDRIEVIQPKPVPQAKKTKTLGDKGGPQRGEGRTPRGR